jgi:hypothetical protein
MRSFTRNLFKEICKSGFLDFHEITQVCIIYIYKHRKQHLEKCYKMFLLFCNSLFLKNEIRNVCTFFNATYFITGQIMALNGSRTAQAERVNS